MPPLRFPVYETLYLINIHSQKLVDLLEELSRRFGIDHESLEYHQSLIQYVRAVACQSITAHMNDIETTEEWLFERQRVNEENKFRDPEDDPLENEPLPQKPPTAKEQNRRDGLISLLAEWMNCRKNCLCSVQGSLALPGKSSDNACGLIYISYTGQYKVVE
jgi:hypothetical protein